MKKIISVMISISLVMSLLAALNLSASASSSKTVSGTYNYDYAAQVLELVNEQREANGLSKLIMTEDLTESAMLRAAEITLSFSHTRPNGDSFYTAFNYTSAAGENIAYGQSSASAVMNSWMNSSGHRANILSSKFTKMGVGCFVYNGTLYWVQVFSGGNGTSYTPSGTKDVTVNVSLVSGVDTTVSSASSVTTTVKETMAKVTTTAATAVSTTNANRTTTENTATTSGLTTSAKPSTTADQITSDNDTTTVKQTTISAETTTANTATTVKEATAASASCTSFAAKPSAASISCITAVSNGFTVKWCRQSSVTGYQVRYSTYCNMFNAVIIMVDDSAAASKTVSDLKANKKYYVQIRTYDTVDGKDCYSCWSASKCVTTKA